jgi:hypothetical protein
MIPKSGVCFQLSTPHVDFTVPWGAHGISGRADAFPQGTKAFQLTDERVPTSVIWDGKTEASPFVSGRILRIEAIRHSAAVRAPSGYRWSALWLSRAPLGSALAQKGTEVGPHKCA